MSSDPATSPPPSERTAVKRGSDRAVYDRDRIAAILAAGTIAHVGVNSGTGPIVLPMAYTATDDELLLHGSVANAMMRAGTSTDVCVTVTVLDGLVVARTPFHNSMNYRSVVVRGEAVAITDPDAKLAALRAINDHLVDIWDTARSPSEVELRQTLVLGVSLDESSAKVRSGDPIDDEEDLSGPHWSGVLPVVTTWGAPRPAEDLLSGIETPAAVMALEGRSVHPASE
jgi:nitroimidazol reductase NimA-like FMN-containing flavoprotein (pyridoxamine 5'-phosphate oxidase superfamily)